MLQIVAYFMNIFLIGRSQLRPWFRWWQSTKRVRVLTTDYNESQKKKHDIDNNSENSDISYVEVIINP